MAIEKQQASDSEPTTKISLVERISEGEAERNTPAVGNDPRPKKLKNPTTSKKWLISLIIGIVGLIGGIICLLVGILGPKKLAEAANYPKIPSKPDEEQTYSALTGETLSDPSLKDAPAYCIQTPNGTDGARPHAGLNEAGVVFEAIAEAGITRFAAIYQNPSSAIIGPIRSLRIYYLQWDTPFDCTIVHAGGSGDALAALSAGGYKDLTENYQYMYRGTYSNRLWNNLFTTSAYLKKFSSDHGYNTSNIKGFARMTPAESAKARVDAGAKEKLNIIKPAEANTSEIIASAPNISLRFGGWVSFNVNYAYDGTTNTYNRSYESGANHEVYKCPAGDLGERNPEDVCEMSQISPSVVIAMMVQERKAADNYHEDITAIGSGDAYIFQNGTAIKGTWNKNSAEDQIKFLDSNKEEISLAPGQTFISAVPTYGSVEY